MHKDDVFLIHQMQFIAFMFMHKVNNFLFSFQSTFNNIGLPDLQISGGWRHTMALDNEGQIYGWGWNKVTHQIYLMKEKSQYNRTRKEEKK